MAFLSPNEACAEPVSAFRAETFSVYCLDQPRLLRGDLLVQNTEVMLVRVAFGPRGLKRVLQSVGFALKIDRVV